MTVHLRQQFLSELRNSGAKGGNAQNGTQNDIISKKPAAAVEAANGPSQVGRTTWPSKYLP